MAGRSTVRAATRTWSPARTLLALLLVAMAAGQLSDVGGFARILDTYRVLPGDAPTLAAWIFIGSEAAAGVALLRRSRHGAVLAIVVALAWTALATQAFARGLTIDNCGCFGIHLGQSLRWWVLIEDAEFSALAAWVYRRQTAASTKTGPPGSKPMSGTAAAAGRKRRPHRSQTLAPAPGDGPPGGHPRRPA